MKDGKMILGPNKEQRNVLEVIRSDKKRKGRIRYCGHLLRTDRDIANIDRFGQQVKKF